MTAFGGKADVAELVLSRSGGAALLIAETRMSFRRCRQLICILDYASDGIAEGWFLRRFQSKFLSRQNYRVFNWCKFARPPPQIRFELGILRRTLGNGIRTVFNIGVDGHPTCHAVLCDAELEIEIVDRVELFDF